MRFGDYLLVDLLGEGGMGAVWAATHISTGQPAAVKLLRDRDASAEARAAFQSEIRLVARCRHPNVIRIYDYGNTDNRSWFAMERVPGGDLRSARIRSWNDLRDILAQVLRGLGHAHARGITHRDLKPENILLGDSAVVSDFGLGHRMSSGENTQAQLYVSGGTPTYMTPEQILGHWRDFGPWTDLYALGCVTYELVCGQPPFREPAVLDLLRQHVEEPMPALRPQFSVPDEVGDWIASLVTKSPHHRIGTAAEALASLPSRLAPSATTPQDVGPVNPVAPTAVQAPTVLLETLTDSTLGQPARAMSEATGAGSQTGVWPRRVSVDLPVLPPAPRDDARDLGWQSASLFGLRPPTFDALAPQRRQLWDVLHTAVDAREWRVVLIDGPEGCGNGPLAWWLAELAHEFGAARIFRAAHAANPGPQHGLSGMLRKALRLEGLSDEAAPERLDELLRAYGMDLLTPAAAQLLGYRSDRDESAFTRYTTTRRLVHNASRGHPAILLLDDLHLSPDSCRFALDAARTPDRVMGPAVVVGVVDRQVRGRELDILRDHDRVVCIETGPMSPEVLAAELRRELRVDPELGLRIAEAAGGFPEYAVRLLDALIRSDELESVDGVWDRPSVDAWELRFDHMWQRHLRRVAPDFDDLQQLGAAVVLGPNTTHDLLEAVLQELDLAPNPDLWERLRAASLVDEDGRTVSVKYTPFRHAVRQLLDHDLSLSTIHRAAARTLERRILDALGYARLAHHHLNSGSPKGALDAALAGLRLAVASQGGNPEVFSNALSVANQAVDLGVGVLAEDLRLLQLAQAANAKAVGDIDRAIELTESLWEERDDVGARATSIRAASLMQKGDLQQVQEILNVRLDGPDPDWAVAACHRTLATVGLRIGDFDMVAEHTGRALELLDEHEEPLPVGWSHYRLADLARRQGDAARAFDELSRARHYFRTAGFPAGLAESMNLQGAVLLGEERFEEAYDTYRRAFEMLKEAGSNWAVTAQLHMALALIYMGEAQSLDALVTDLRDALRRKNFELFNVFGMLVECAVATELADVRRFDAVAHQAREKVKLMQERDHDLLNLIDWIHARWQSHGDDRRAAWFAP